MDALSSAALHDLLNSQVTASSLSAVSLGGGTVTFAMIMSRLTPFLQGPVEIVDDLTSSFWRLWSQIKRGMHASAIWVLHQIIASISGSIQSIND